MIIQEVNLTEPSEESGGFAMWGDTGVMAMRGSGRVRCELEDHRMSVGGARGVAAALLAAAEHAEALL